MARSRAGTSRLTFAYAAMRATSPVQTPDSRVALVPGRPRSVVFQTSGKRKLSLMDQDYIGTFESIFTDK
jgi:hypothetical protein